MAYEDFKYYYYTPSMAGAVIVLLLWIAATTIHLWQAVITRTKFFIPFLIGVFMEFVGYCARAASASQAPDYRLMAYVIQSTYILLAPTLMAASIYMEMGRIIRLTDGEEHSIISTRWVTKIFVTGDIFCLAMQSGGCGLSAAGKSIGTDIVIAGLILQLLVLLCFATVAAVFAVRMRRVPTSKSMATSVDWYRHVLIMYLACGLMAVRSVVRLAEYVQGYQGYIMTHEWCLYLLDFVPMAIVVAVYAWFHPSEIHAALKGGKAVHQVYRMKSYLPVYIRAVPQSNCVARQQYCHHSAV